MTALTVNTISNHCDLRSENITLIWTLSNRIVWEGGHIMWPSNYHVIMSQNLWHFRIFFELIHEFTWKLYLVLRNWNESTSKLNLFPDQWPQFWILIDRSKLFRVQKFNPICIFDRYNRSAWNDRYIYIYIYLHCLKPTIFDSLNFIIVSHTFEIQEVLDIFLFWA